MKMRIFKYCMALMLVLCIAIQILPVSVYARDTVEVACVEIPGFIQRDGAAVTGYAADYLSRLGALEGLSFHYSFYTDRQEAAGALRERRADLMLPAAEAGEGLLCSAEPFATDFGVLLVRKADARFSYDELQKLQGLTVGYVEEENLMGSFLQYAKDKGIRVKTRKYETTDALLEGLQLKQVDAIVTDEIQASKTEKMVCRFARSRMYFLFREDETALKAQVDSTMLEMEAGEPKFEASLWDKYFSWYDVSPLTAEEEEFSKTLPVLRVGYPADHAPLSWRNKNGEPEGIEIRLLKLVEANSGLRFQYVPIEEDITALDLDLLAGSTELAKQWDSDSIRGTEPYLLEQCLLITAKGGLFSEIETLAIPEVLADAESTIFDQWPQMEVSVVKDGKTCLNEVQKGEYDAALLTGGVASTYLRQSRYADCAILMTNSLYQAMNLQLSPKWDGEKGEKLLLLLNHAIAMIDSDRVHLEKIESLSRNDVRADLENVLYTYRGGLIAMAVFLLLILLLCALWHRRVIEVHQKQREEAQGIRMILSDVREGLLLLEMSEPIRVLYVNQALRDRLNKKNVGLDDVFLDDRASLNKQLSTLHTQGDTMEVRIRLLNAAGCPIPFLFNAKAHLWRKQLQILCRLHEVEEEEKLHLQLAMAHQYSQVLVKQSAEAMFDLDAVERKVTYSYQYAELFGWSGMDEDFFGDKVGGLTLAKEDVGLYEEIRRKVLACVPTIITRMRLKQQDGSFSWFDVRLTVLSQNGKVTRIIGRLTNVDQQVRETERSVMLKLRDGATGMYNAVAFRYLVEQYMNNASSMERCALFMLALDEEEAFSTHFSPEEQQEIVRLLGQTLRRQFRAQDYIARFAPGRLCVFAKEMPEETIRRKAATISYEMSQSVQEAGYEAVSVSCGAACGFSEGVTLDQAVEMAGEALRQARKKGKVQFSIVEQNS